MPDRRPSPGSPCGSAIENFANDCGRGFALHVTSQVAIEHQRSPARPVADRPLNSPVAQPDDLHEAPALVLDTLEFVVPLSPEYDLPMDWESDGFG